MKKIIKGKGTVRAGKWFNLFISNEDMDDIIKIVKSLEDSGVLIGATETAKHEIKKQEDGSLGAMMATMAASLIQPVVSSLINAISEREVKKTEKRQKGGFLPLIALPLMMKATDNLRTLSCVDVIASIS